MQIGVDVRETIGNKTGKGFYTLNLLKAILKKNKDFKFILYSDKETDLFNKYLNVRLKVIELKGMLWHLKVFKNLKKDGIDLFWAPTSYIIPFLIGKKLPFIITVHDIVAFLFPSWHNKKAVLIEKLTLKRALKYATKIFVVSENTGKDLVNYFHVTKDRLVVTYNGIAHVGAHCNAPLRANKYILTIGTLEPRKNHIRLIQAFDLIKNEFPNLKLLIGGGKGWGYKNIFDEVEKLHLKDRVEFLGYVKNEDLPALYSNAELFAFPSLYEGFGIPIVEAMNYGCPVLTSNNSAMAEVAGDAALLVDPLNVESIAIGMRKILKDSYLREKLVKDGFNRVRQFTWGNSATNALSEFVILNTTFKHTTS